MPTKNKLAKQMIQKHSLQAIPAPWHGAAIRAIMEFAELAAKHERKAVRAMVRRAYKEKNDLQYSINEYKMEAKEL